MMSMKLLLGVLSCTLIQSCLLKSGACVRHANRKSHDSDQLSKLLE